MTLDEAFKRAGGLGRFHALVFITLSVCLMAGEIYNAVLMYFNKLPQMICNYSDGRSAQCDWETACTS